MENSLTNLRFLDVGDEDNDYGGVIRLPLTSIQDKSIKMTEAKDDVGQVVSTKNMVKNDPVKAKTFVDHNLTLSSLEESLDDIDSIQFELDEDAFKEIDDESFEEQVTLDVTEGGPCDVKNFHEVYQIDLSSHENQENRPNDKNKSKMERPKSAKTRIRNIKPALEINDDLDNYIDDDVDGDDDFSLKSIETDPFAGEGVGLFQVSRQELITVPSFSSNQLETLDEESDEDIRNGDGEEEQKDEQDEFEEDEPTDDDKKTQKWNDFADDRQEHQLIDFIGQQANFKKMSDQLKIEISKLRSELLTVLTVKSDEIANKTVKRLDGVEKRLVENEKSINFLQSDQIKQKTESLNNSGADCSTEVNKIRLELKSISNKVDDFKDLFDKENSHFGKSLIDIKDEFRVTMDQFRDFKKDNDLAIKALRKQVTEVSKSQDNLESLTSNIQSDIHRLSRDFNNIRRDDDEDQDNLRSEVKQMIMKERVANDKLAQSIEDIRHYVKKEFSLINETFEKHNRETELVQASLNDEMSQTKAVLHYLTKELDIIKQSAEEKKNLTEIQDSEVKTTNVTLEERLNQVDAHLTAIDGKLEAIKISKEREQRMNNKFNNYNSKKPRKVISSCSSYEDTLSSSSEEIGRNREKRFRSKKDYNPAGASNHRSKVIPDNGLNRRPDYIKYSPLHFSPILITSQPMERSRNVKSSSSLLAMIRRTSRLLLDEASDLEGLGNYRFVSDVSNGLLKSDVDADESAIRKLKQIRCDVDEKLKRLNTMVNSNSKGNNTTSTKS